MARPCHRWLVCFIVATQIGMFVSYFVHSTVESRSHGVRQSHFFIRNSPQQDEKTLPTQHDDVACTRCGCVCDDLSITIENGRIVDAKGACELAESWFLEQGKDEPPAAMIEGRTAEFDVAIKRAAEILAGARYPLIYGLSRSSTRGQRAAVRLADRIGAAIDTTASQCHAPSIMAIQQVGESTCSLGEAKNRCDLVIFWGCDPAKTHPRHAERYSVTPVGMFLPRGRKDRFVVVIDCKQTDSAQLADWFIEVDKESDFEVIWSLRHLIRGGAIQDKVGGISAHALRTLGKRMVSCTSGVVYFGLGLAKPATGHATVEALLRMVRDLNAKTRFYARRMRIPGDVTGADSVVCWQTGFPFAVNLARGYPRFNPGEYSAKEVLERREADACLLLGGEGVEQLPGRAVAHLRDIPIILVENPGVKSLVPSAVHFTTAVYGIHAAGTAYRMDEVPIPLRPMLSSKLPTDDQVLDQICDQCRDACED